MSEDSHVAGTPGVAGTSTAAGTAAAVGPPTEAAGTPTAAGTAAAARPPTEAAGTAEAAGATDEVRRLRAEIDRLGQQLAATGPPAEPAGPKPTGQRRWRSISATVLIVIACLLAPLAVVSVWASNMVSNTDRYVQTMAPLARDPDIQAVVTNAVSEQIFNAVDIDSLTTQAVDGLSKVGLPPLVTGQLQGLAVPIANGVESFIRAQVAKIVSSPQFARAWDAANRAAHTQLNAVMTGNQGGAISTKDGVVTLNLGPFISQVKDKLVAQGITIANKIPRVDRTITLFQSKDITKAQSGYRLLNTLGDWLPAIALAIGGVGVYVTRRHRRALIGLTLGIAGSMLVLGLGLTIGRAVYLNQVPTDVLPHDAAAVLYDTLIRFLRNSLRLVGLAAIIVAIGAFFVGGSVTATRSRKAVVGGIGWLREKSESAGVRTGPVGSWVYAHKRWLWAALIAIAAAMIVLSTYPSIGLIVAASLVVVIGAAIVEFLGRPPARPSAG